VAIARDLAAQEAMDTWMVPLIGPLPPYPVHTRGSSDWHSDSGERHRPLPWRPQAAAVEASSMCQLLVAIWSVLGDT
jgi:hypothetical protein